MPDILKQIPIKPDFILLNDLHPTYCPIIKNIDRVTIPVGSIVHDLHYKTEYRRQFFKEQKIDFIFPHYRDAFLRWFPEFENRMIWFPHHVPLHIFKDYQLPKTIDYLFVGACVPFVYPLRAKMIEQLKNEKGFVMYGHPGYKPINYQSEQYVVGEKYAQLINRSKMLFTCNSIYQYPVLKYFETAACNTLLLANGSKELRDLGFIDGKTFVEVNETNVLEKARYYLNNETERVKIAANAYQMVRKRHSTEKRANELIQFIRGL